MVVVDLRLFVTCRLCLEAQGHYHIDPNVRNQIKYCFDIDVEPFDGLPQLICKKCNKILRNYYARKIFFTEKQEELKTKLKRNARKGDKSPSPQQNESDSCKKNKSNSKHLSISDDSDSSDNKDECHEKIKRKKKKVKKRIVNRLMSSSDESQPDDSSELQIIANSMTDSSFKSHGAWDANFNKYFACRICSEKFQDKEGITTHIKKHSQLVTKYENIFKMSCLVVMERSDTKPNICNSKKTVVYSSDTIIQNEHNPFYYIWYHPKSYSTIPDTFKAISEKNVSSSESTENETHPRKRRRLLSESSSETVVINRNSEDEDAFQDNINPPTTIDCIELGDSSDDGSHESNDKSRNSTDKNDLDSKSMENIINMCHNKYIKKLDSLEKKYPVNDTGKEDFLQHKVLSIGRKIINNKGFSCTGLLRFLEYKDLSVIWKETSVLNARNNSKYVRIATRLRGNERSDTNNAEWKNFSTSPFAHCTLPSSDFVNQLITYENFKNLKSVPNDEENIVSVENLPRISSVFSHTDLDITNNDTDHLILKKLLNENPVSNPKQLPKKVNNTESYAKAMKVFSAPNTLPVSTRQAETNNEPDVNTMPIVTSIVSLAPVADKDKNIQTEESKSTSSNQQTYPRIRVKAVTELMPDNTVTNTVSNDTYVSGARNQTPIGMSPTQTAALNTPQRWPATQTNATVRPKLLPSNPQMCQNRNDSFIQPKTNEQYKTVSVDNVPQSSKASDSPKELLTLDTVELPNKKTNSPFQYLKDLLIVHNIILVAAGQPVPTGSVSLIKLKLVYQQDKCQPITLCLSLFCLKNVFCIQVKDTNLVDVNINNLSANWQWQLLKIYNNEVINKVLQTAEKVGLETYKYTQDFFALLKSIKAKHENL